MDNRKTQAKQKKELSDIIDIAMKSNELANENPFPINAFPLLFRELIVDLNTSLNYPIDYTGTAILSAVATVVGTSAKVQVKNNWFEFGSLFCCIIGDAGANKTHPINTIFKPIKEIDKKNHNEYEIKYSEYEAYMNLSKKEKNNTEVVLKPFLKKLVMTNYTPEVLNKRLSENARGCNIVSDELITFLEGMNNYSKADQMSVYLSFWSNQPITIDRMGENIPILIQHPYVSILGGLQPRLIKKSFPTQKLNNGFFQRFLYAFPQSTFKMGINENESDSFIFERYSEYIKNYIQSTEISEIEGKLNNKIINWTKDAKKYFIEWQHENCNKVNENQNNIKGEIISKYDNHFIRLSLLLQLMENPKSNEIGMRAVEGADNLCSYFMNCAFKVLAHIQNPKEYLESLPENKKEFYLNITDDFKTSEAVELAKNHDITERRIKEFLNDEILFKRIKHGFYKKIIKK
jgi:hypothetical protein